MAAANRSRARSVGRTLVEHPQRFEFFEAVRLLERFFSQRAAVGGDAAPRDEAVRFSSDVSLSFPVGDISEVRLPDAPAAEADASNEQAGEPAHMRVSFMGMASPQSFGSLPLPYTVEVLEQERARNHALRDFLDLFNHRFVSLFYRAWKKSRLGMQAESVQAGSAPESAFERALFSIIGLGTPGLRHRLPLDDRSLLSRAGLLARRPAPPQAIEALIESCFGAPAHVEPFMPMWYAVQPHERTRLGLAHASLGQEAFLGSEALLFSAKFRVRIGPLGRAEYERLLPHGSAYPGLCRLIRLAAGSDLDFDVQLVLASAEVPRLRLGTHAACPVRLGGSTWLSSGPRLGDADDAVLNPPPDLLPSTVADFLSSTA